MQHGGCNAETLLTTIRLPDTQEPSLAPVEGFPQGTCSILLADHEQKLPVRARYLHFRASGRDARAIARDLHEIAQKLMQWPGTTGEMLIEVSPVAEGLIGSGVEFWRYRITPGQLEQCRGLVKWLDWEKFERADR